MIPIHKNTCPAFFLDATIDSAGNYSPCTALGGQLMNFGDQFLDEIWKNPKIEKLRAQSAAGKQLSTCTRCWSEEKLNFVSERNYLTQDVPEDTDYVDPAYYSMGPRHLNIKVSNICNLRCRTCQSYDSYLYNIEGEYYNKKYNLNNKFYNAGILKKHFTDEQLDQLYKFSDNLERIELYGGEPFLDDQIPKFLNKLIDNGRSRDIDFSVSTNATHELTDSWEKILTSYRDVVINISIDAIGNQFTYMRHPGKWKDVEKNIKSFFELEYANTNITVQPVVTVSALNVYSLGEIFEYFKLYNVEPFIILVQIPKYYCVNVIPDDIKLIVEKKLQSYNNSKFDPVINLLRSPQNGSDNTWDKFKFWTRAKDEYRKESFIECFEEFGKILLEHNKW